MSDMDGILLDVRQAYRLLNEYHRRILDIIKQIENHFDPIEFRYWWTPQAVLQNSTAKGALDLDHGFFALMPGQSITFQYAKKTGSPRMQWLVEVSHYGDDPELGRDSPLFASSGYDVRTLQKAQSTTSRIFIDSFCILNADMKRAEDAWDNAPSFSEKSITLGSSFEKSPDGTLKAWRGSVGKIDAVMVQSSLNVTLLANPKFIEKVCQAHVAMVTKKLSLQE